MNDAMDPEGGGARASARERRLARGLQFADMLGFTNQRETRENRVTVEALAELLIAKGVLHLRELEERKQAIARADEEERDRPAVHLVATEDKYAAAGAAPIDCENRLHLCREGQRIWRDFERYVPNPDIARDDWPGDGEQAGDAAAAPSAED